MEQQEYPLSHSNFYHLASLFLEYFLIFFSPLSHQVYGDGGALGPELKISKVVDSISGMQLPKETFILHFMQR